MNNTITPTCFVFLHFLVFTSSMLLSFLHFSFNVHFCVFPGQRSRKRDREREREKKKKRERKKEIRKRKQKEKKEKDEHEKRKKGRFSKNTKITFR